MIVLICFILCGFLLLASAFFSASETALVALSPQKVKTLALRSPTLSADLARWLDKPDELLTLILAGNTLVNVMFAALVTVLATRFFPFLSLTQVEWVSWIFGTLIVVIIGEMGPKFMARSNPERTTFFLLPWLSRLRSIVGPLLKKTSSFLGFFVGGAPSASGSIRTFSMDELKSLLEEGHVGKDVSPDSVNMMQRALDIHDRRTESIMTKLENVDMIEIDPPGKPPRGRGFLLDLIVENGHTRTPVKKEGHIMGFIHSADLLPFILRDTGRDLSQMVRKALEIPADRRVNDLLIDFQTTGIHAGFVKDAQGKIIGLVTLEDVLEEITGEILDEYDVVFPSTKETES